MSWGERRMGSDAKDRVAELRLEWMEALECGGVAPGTYYYFRDMPQPFDLRAFQWVHAYARTLTPPRRAEYEERHAPCFMCPCAHGSAPCRQGFVLT